MSLPFSQSCLSAEAALPLDISYCRHSIVYFMNSCASPFNVISYSLPNESTTIAVSPIKLDKFSIISSVINLKAAYLS